MSFMTLGVSSKTLKDTPHTKLVGYTVLEPITTASPIGGTQSP